jgi:hypothetical protein
MKRMSVCSLLMLALARVALGQTSQFYINDGVVNAPPDIPPQIDAINFVNNNLFTINFTNLSLDIQLFDFSNTRNYTNRGIMTGNTGFEFDTAPTSSGQRQPAANFHNFGTISAGSSTNFFFSLTNFFFFGTGFPQVRVSADNIANPGNIVVGTDGLLSLKGRKVDLSRGGLVMEGFEQSIFFNAGIVDNYWGLGTNLMSPAFEFEVPPPSSPFHIVTQLTGGLYFVFVQRLLLPGAVGYVDDFTDASGTNRTVQAVILSETNSAFSHQVFFPFFPEIAIEWTWNQTNQATGVTTTNYMYLVDNYFTNQFFTNANFLTGQATYPPVNYSFIRGGPLFFGTPTPPGLPPGTFDFPNVTNEYTAYSALFLPTSATTRGVAGQSITNSPGRIEITAQDELNLNRARITGLNYLLLKSTNHFDGSARAQILSPYSDIFLGTTNGNLVITNLLIPEVPRLTGEVDMWSGRWTNTDPAGVTTRYHVLVVDSRLTPTFPAQIQDLTLRSTNIVISDRLNVTRNFLIDGQRLTITTNEPGAATASGEINLLSSAITWSTSTPRLQYLTNDGAMTAQNAVFFGGSRTQPFYNSTFDEPYLAFVNHGQIANQGSLIWANYFENTGTIDAGIGSINLQRSLSAILSNGLLLATSGDITLNSGSLVISNTILAAGRALTLAPTNFLTDGYPLLNQNGQVVTTNTPPMGGITNGNFWLAGNGFSILTKPPTGDLLATVVSNSLPDYAESFNRWAGEDRGCSPAGFVNNLALGVLTLDGGFDSQFTFTVTGGANALYVDRLDLRDYSTNRDAGGDFIGINIEPNMHIYFADATANGVSIAEKMDGRNGGRLCWVRDYAGAFSSTNLTYPDGTTYAFNAALAASCNIDSDNDGTVNCNDLTPFFVSSTLALAVTINNTPAPMALVSWNTAPLSTNYLYSSPSPQNGTTNWQLVTNFVFGPAAGRVTVAEPMSPNGPRFYRVRVVPRQ